MSDETENDCTITAMKNQAFEMNLTGHSYLLIADTFGVEVKRVRQWVIAELVRRAEAREHDPAVIVELHLAQLCELSNAIQPQADAGNLEAAITMLKILAHRERLLGLCNAIKT